MYWYWLPINNFCRDALILLKVCRRIDHCKVQVKFNISNHPQNLAELWSFWDLVFCWCVDIGFRSITFAGMHWLYWKFAKGYTIVKYRSSLILVIICKILCKLWPVFDLVAFRDRSDYKDHCFFPFSYQMVGALCWWHIRFSDTSDSRNSSSLFVSWWFYMWHLFCYVSYVAFVPHLFFLQCLVCVEVLRPSQPIGVMLSAVSLPNHTFIGQA